MDVGENTNLVAAINRWKFGKANGEDLTMIREAWLSGIIVIKSDEKTHEGDNLIRTNKNIRIESQRSQGLVNEPSGPITQIFFQVADEQKAKAIINQLQPPNHLNVPVVEGLKSVQLILEGNSSEFDRTRQEYLRSVLAAILSVNQDAIRILQVMEGSIKIILGIPESAAVRLIELVELDDPRLNELGIIKAEILDNLVTQVPQEIQFRVFIIQTQETEQDINGAISIIREVGEVEVLSDRASQLTSNLKQQISQPRKRISRDRKKSLQERRLEEKRKRSRKKGMDAGYHDSSSDN